MQPTKESTESTKCSDTEPVAQKQIAPEFSSWPVNEVTMGQIIQVRFKFDELLSWIEQRTPPGNSRYLAIVKTKLEEASMFTVKGFSKPA